MKKKYLALGIMVVITLLSVFLMTRVKIVTDMTTYLPDKSKMSQGIDVMKEQFPGMNMNQNIIRVMTNDMSEEKFEEFLAELKQLNGATVTYEVGSEAYNKDGHRLVTLTLDFESNTKKMKSTLKSIKSLKKSYDFIYESEAENRGLPTWIAIAAVVILMIILFLMCNSWFEPILFLITIGIAVLINMGTNAFLPGVSSITHSISSILQLVLSMDYSIILINRYRQELAYKDDRIAAMNQAIKKSAMSIASSAITTIVGLLSLCFMSFKIGADLGIVLAKGVLISLICILTVLPTLILIFDKLIQKTTKKVLNIKMDAISRFCEKSKFVLLGVFLVMFVGLFMVKDRTKITFGMYSVSDINQVFPQTNQVVVLYSNEDEEHITDVIANITGKDNVGNIFAYGNTIGKKCTASEMVAFIDGMAPGMGFDEKLVSALFENYAVTNDISFSELRMSIDELFKYIVDASDTEEIKGIVPESILSNIGLYEFGFSAAKSQLVAKEFSIMMIETPMLEDEANNALASMIKNEFEKNCNGDFYMIGETAMNYEMSQSFGKEFNKITLITAIAIFIVVLLSFKSIPVPLILVAMIQTAVYATMFAMTVKGQGMNYLALLIVQSILMGATIDYAILFTNYYREKRLSDDVATAMRGAYNGSIHTIMTSGLIMVTITFILGYAFPDESTKQICHLISIGVLIALILIVFVLPGTLSALDKLVIKKRTNKK